MPVQVLIIGAGLGGLILAQCLRKQGIGFQIFERDSSASARGQGYAIGLHRLEELKPFLPDDLPPLESSCHLLPLNLPSQMIFYLKGLRVGVEDSARTPCLRANRVRLRELLSTNLDISWDKRANRIEESDENVTVWFEDGTCATGDILVGADGTFSTIREHVLRRKNNEILQVIPEAIILGNVTLSGEAFRRQLNLGHSAYIVLANGWRLFNGLNRVFPDGKSAEYYWMTYAQDSTAGNPNHWLKTSTQQEIYNYCLNKAQELEPKFREIVETAPVDGVKGMVTFWEAEISTLPPVRRVVLIGDSAHPITPFRGEGGILAIKDATRLSEVLTQVDSSNHDEMRDILNKFQEEVTLRGSEAVALARSAFARASASELPMCWGHRSEVMEEKPVDIQL